jgi:predicted ribosome-associated RNA-binding protein Tma20
MQISFVMLNNHEIISLIENRLDSVSAEYQSVDNKIEIYRLDGDLIILEINQNIFSILYKENKYDFKESDQFFNKLDELIS